MDYTITFVDKNGSVELQTNFDHQEKLDESMSRAKKVAHVALAILLKIDANGLKQLARKN